MLLENGPHAQTVKAVIQKRLNMKSPCPFELAETLVREYQNLISLVLECLTMAIAFGLWVPPLTLGVALLCPVYLFVIALSNDLNDLVHAMQPLAVSVLTALCNR